jgi:hypothetical protein
MSKSTPVRSCASQMLQTFQINVFRYPVMLPIPLNADDRQSFSSNSLFPLSDLEAAVRGYGGILDLCKGDENGHLFAVSQSAEGPTLLQL